MAAVLRTIPSREVMAGLPFALTSDETIGRIGRQFPFVAIGSTMVGVETLQTTLYPDTWRYESGSFVVGAERGNKLANTPILDIEKRLKTWGLVRTMSDELFRGPSLLAPGSPVVAALIDGRRVNHFALSHIGDDGRLIPRWTSKLGTTEHVIRHAITDLVSPRYGRSGAFFAGSPETCGNPDWLYPTAVVAPL